MSTNSEEVDVLIVGAGPAGLGTALSLQHYSQSLKGQGIKKPKVLICDSYLEGKDESRAYVMHARTLEELDAINCAKPLLPLGIECDAFRTQSMTDPNKLGSVIAEYKFSSLRGKTQFTFALFIAQHVTEVELSRILRERIERDQDGMTTFTRGLMVTGIKEAEKDTKDGKKKGFLVTFDNGSTIWCQYLVGADGSRSIVRTSMNIPFTDPEPNTLATLSGSQEYFCISDVIFEGEIEKKRQDLKMAATMTFGPKGHFLYAPMKNLSKEEAGDYLYRLSFVIPEEELAMARFSLSNSSKKADTREASGYPSTHWEKFVARPEALDYLQKKVDNGFQYIPANPSPENLPICPTNGTLPRLEKVLWSSIYRIRYAIADFYHKSFSCDSGEENYRGEGVAAAGHALLVGDAAHVHSPFGRQGMNLGIRDGLRCGKAIAEHWGNTHTHSIINNTTVTQVLDQALASVDPLERYATIQHKEALETIETTKVFSRVATLKTGSTRGIIRDWTLWLTGLFRSYRNNWIWIVSGLGKPGF